MPPFIIDTHCHLDYIINGLYGHDPAPTCEAVLQRANTHEVRYLINPSVHPADFERVIALAESQANVFAAVAIHPCDTDAVHEYPDWLKQLRHYAQHPKVVALGETGLDYYHQPAEVCDIQRACFAQTLNLAGELHLPVIVHDREAHDDVLKAIQTAQQTHPHLQGVMHCFGGDASFARTMAAHGFYISFAGNVTFKKAETLREAVAATPLDKLLIETDSPFLSPMPERGKPNEPYRTRFVAECIANIKELSVEEVMQHTTANACRLFTKLAL
ncbi:MAG: TatD family hydrolase [Vampirovibrionales bacterium]